MLKLISVNIEMDMHHDTAIPFLQKENADIVCVQEIFKQDIGMYEEALGMKSYFEPMAYTMSYKFGGKQDKIYGVAIFTKHKAEVHFSNIVGNEKEIPLLMMPKDREKERDNSRRVVLWVDINILNNAYRVATTHFTWTPPPGISTLYQKEDARKLIQILDQDLKEFIIVGDFNAPRGKETFQMFAEKYKDNIPLEYNSSLDLKLHRSLEIRSGERSNMVDGLFTTPEYKVIDCKLIDSVSDHKAVVANIERI